MRVLPLVLVLSCGWACAPTEEQLPSTLVSDLVADLALAEVRVEPGRIDLGTTEARAHLGDGWSWNERGKDGKSFVWGTWQGSEVWFYLQRPRPLTVEMHCLPFRRAEGSVEALGVDVNGVRIREIGLQRGWREYSFDIPAEIVRSGVNRLEFVYDWSVADLDEVPKTKSRRVAVAWDWVRFRNAGGAPPTASAETGRLTLTPNSQVDYFLELPGGSLLAIESVEAPTADGSTLEISLLTDGEPEEKVLMLDAAVAPVLDSRPVRWRLSDEPELVRLRFQSAGEFVLTQPRVLADIPEPAAAAPADSESAPLLPSTDPSLVLVYLIDTLRADHLGRDGYARGTTPVIDRWMDDAVVFSNTLAASSWTKPSVASLLTGRLPWTHGAEGDRDTVAQDLPVMAEHFRRLGFRTAGFSTNGYVSADFGFDRGFDHFELMPEFDTPAAGVHQVALDWLADQPRDERIFLYLQTIDPHTPYDPAAPQRERFVEGNPAGEVGSIPFMRELAQSRRAPEPELVRDLIDLYDAEVAYSDQEFGQLIDALRQQGRYDDALVVLLSDHGEEFYDHGSWTHSRTLHREVLRVPLAIRFPHDWGAGTRVTQTVQLIDLVPTLLDYFGRPVPPELPGTSLLCQLARAVGDRTTACPPSDPRPLFSSVHHHNNHWVGIVLGDWKLVLRSPERLDSEAQLFDLTSDPLERDNLADRHPVRVGYLTSWIRRELALGSRAGPPSSIELDDETTERLRALGYLN